MMTDMTDLECRALLTSETLGRLGCSRDNQAYVVPISYVLEQGTIYAFSSIGQKIDWMRDNPRICLQVDRIRTRLDWISVLVFGRFEEIPDDELHTRERETAWDILNKRPNWWEPAFTTTIKAGRARQMKPLYFRIRIDSITGCRMKADTPASADIEESSS